MPTMFTSRLIPACKKSTPSASRKTAGAIALCISLSISLLTGCAALTPPDGSSEAAQTATQRKYTEALELDGRLSVQYQKNDRDEAIHVSFNWNQNADHSTITILSPLGQILSTIDISADGATLLQAGRPPRTASDVDALAEQALGWPLPVSGLRQWLQGFATDANQQAFVAAAADDHVTTRDGWRIRYVIWQDDNQLPPQSRPKRIDLERQTEQAGKVAIRIVLDNWQAR